MPKAEFCKEYNKNVWLKEDGSCQNGHPASSIDNVYETEDEAEKNRKEENFTGSYPNHCWYCSLWLCGGCAFLAFLTEPPKSEKKKTEVAKPEKKEEPKKQGESKREKRHTFDIPDLLGKTIGQIRAELVNQ